MDDPVGELLRAIRFAAEKHRDQRRKNAASAPYINHPIAVAELIHTVGRIRELTTLLGAVLHDTIEDTATSVQELAHLFGEEVAQLVVEVSDDKSLPKAERKRLQVATAGDKSPRARAIKLADMCCNMVDLARDPPVGWSRERQWGYLAWCEEVAAGLRGPHPLLEAHFDHILDTARRQLATPG